MALEMSYSRDADMWGSPSYAIRVVAREITGNSMPFNPRSLIRHPSTLKTVQPFHIYPGRRSEKDVISRFESSLFHSSAQRRRYTGPTRLQLELLKGDDLRVRLDEESDGLGSTC